MKKKNDIQLAMKAKQDFHRQEVRKAIIEKSMNKKRIELQNPKLPQKGKSQNMIQSNKTAVQNKLISKTNFKQGQKIDTNKHAEISSVQEKYKIQINNPKNDCPQNDNPQPYQIDQKINLEAQPQLNENLNNNEQVKQVYNYQEVVSKNLGVQTLNSNTEKSNQILQQQQIQENHQANKQKNEQDLEQIQQPPTENTSNDLQEPVPLQSNQPSIYLEPLTIPSTNFTSQKPKSSVQLMQMLPEASENQQEAPSSLQQISTEPKKPQVQAQNPLLVIESSQISLHQNIPEETKPEKKASKTLVQLPVKLTKQEVQKIFSDLSIDPPTCHCVLESIRMGLYTIKFKEDLNQYLQINTRNCFICKSTKLPLVQLKDLLYQVDCHNGQDIFGKNAPFRCEDCDCGFYVTQLCKGKPVFEYGPKNVNHCVKCTNFGTCQKNNHCEQCDSHHEQQQQCEKQNQMV